MWSLSLLGLLLVDQVYLECGGFVLDLAVLGFGQSPHSLIEPKEVSAEHAATPLQVNLLGLVQHLVQVAVLLHFVVEDRDWQVKDQLEFADKQSVLAKFLWPKLL